MQCCEGLLCLTGFILFFSLPLREKKDTFDAVSKIKIDLYVSFHANFPKKINLLKRVCLLLRGVGMLVSFWEVELSLSFS